MPTLTMRRVIESVSVQLITGPVMNSLLGTRYSRRSQSRMVVARMRSRVTRPSVVPTVTINEAAAQPDPTNDSPILFSVVFSESVTGFIGSDVSLAGSTAGGTLSAMVTGSGANYTVSVTGMNGVGSVVASIPAGVKACDLTHQDFAAVVDRDHRGGQPRPFLVGEDLGLLAVHDRDDGVGRTQVDADDLAHCRLLQGIPFVCWAT